MLRALLLFASATAARALRAPAAPQAAARSLFHEELATLRAVADGASATGRFRPHARYTSRFGEALRHGAGSDPDTASLHADVHVGREDLYLRPASCARRVERPMARSVRGARRARVALHHAAACDVDAVHADALPRVATRRGDGDFWAGPAARGALGVVAHGGCESHDLAGHLGHTGRLDDLLARAIEDAVNSH
ncbi:hypothetical protein JL720_15107 [Aureococcus anophagefferens]|nr:hypothetical protein JL720_15107 [Aureococcus anophagefferens]